MGSVLTRKNAMLQQQDQAKNQFYRETKYHMKEHVRDGARDKRSKRSKLLFWRRRKHEAQLAMEKANALEREKNEREKQRKVEEKYERQKQEQKERAQEALMAQEKQLGWKFKIKSYLSQSLQYSATMDSDGCYQYDSISINSSRSGSYRSKYYKNGKYPLQLDPNVVIFHNKENTI